MIKYIFLIICCLSLTEFSAQGENNNWIFGGGGGLNFNSTPPEYLVGSAMQNSSFGVCTVSSSCGDLLFYSDGKTIWNSEHTIIENGQNLKGSTIGIQTVVATRIPKSTLYILFTLEDGGNPGRLHYSLIDIAEENGRGLVIEKNIFVADELTEGMILAKRDESHLWLIVHDRCSDNFLSYEITENGFNQNPVISSADQMINFDTNSCGTSTLLAEMNINAQHDIVTNLFGGINMFEFDKLSGKLKYKNSIATGKRFHAVCFSPSGRFLYAYEPNRSNSRFEDLVQFDLLDTDINSSKVVLNEEGFPGGIPGIQRGPNGKIYLNHELGPYISVIHTPNKKGVEANFELKAISAPSNNILAGTLQNLVVVADQQPDLQAPFPKDSVICTASQIILDSTSDGVSYLWNDGSTSPIKEISLSGIYWLERTFSNCLIRTDSIDIIFRNDLHLNLGEDQVICDNPSYQLDSPFISKSYNWSTGDTIPSIEVNTSGDFWLEVETKEGCILRDTINVSFANSNEFSFGDDIVACDQSSVLLESPIQGQSYLWSTNQITQSIEVVRSGQYWLEVTDGQCSSKDTILVALEELQVNLGSDEELCPEDSIILTANVSGNYFWSDGSTSSTIVVRTTGTFWLEVETANCLDADTINIIPGACDIETPIDSTETSEPQVSIPSNACIGYVPNAINRIPQADNSNNLLRIFSNCNLTSQKLKLYDKWGNLFYEGNAIDFDALQLNVNPGVYVVKFNYQFEGHQEQRQLLQTIAIF